MKKIYILTAVFALLTLSLNAQLTKQVVEQAKSSKNVNNDEKVVTPPDGFFRMGPSRASSTPVTPPYSNSFDSNNEWQWWEAIDAAGDGYTSSWFGTTYYYGQWTLSSNTACYVYHRNNAADDWLVTAPITLKAGKTYKFYLDTWADGYTERIEVKMASDHTASALSAGATVIAAQDVTSTSSNPTHLSNESITVDADGDYYIGIHAISAADRYNLYVDNFVIDVDNSGPKIEVSPESLTINDSGTNNTFTVQGSNLGTDNVGVTPNNGFSTTTDDQNWGFENNNGSVSGTVTVTYEGRDLSATGTVSVANNLTSATVNVTYVPDLYIYCDNGASSWDFSANPAVAMTNKGNGIYTATLQNIPANSHILFGRASGLTYGWEGDNNRLFIGASTGGDDWAYGDYTWGYLDTDPRDDNPVKYHPIAFSEGGTYTITINANDYTFSIEKLVLPPPENVAAVADSENQKATVTWKAPSNPPIQSVTEDFEDTNVFPAFTTGGITATTHTGAFGDWTLYDATGGCVVYGSTELIYANEGQPQAWFVFKPSGATPDTGYETSVPHAVHSGEQYLESICPTSGSSAAGVADHWLISPELSGNAQTISFYNSALTTRYVPETYEIWVSSTDNTAPSSFTKLGNTYSISVSTWEKQTVDLPAGTKYFAIRHTSNDKFALLIDDVTYEGAIKPVSYNVYLEGELVGNVLANETLTYTFTNLEPGNYECAVSAVYPGDIESELVPAQFTIIERTATPTITVVANADGSKTISATGNGEVHLYVDGQEVTNPYTIMPSPDGDMAYTVTATAKEEGKLISETAEQIVTVAEGGRTPAPAIIVEEHNGYVVITAYGDGTVTLNVDGQTAEGEGSASITIVKSTEEQEVTATATAQDGDLLESRPTTKEVTIHALNSTPTNPASGLLRLHLLMVDQMKQDIPADNSHPDRYSYILRYEPNGVGGTGTKESGTVHVDIQKADCEVMGAYTLTEVDNDKHIGSVQKDDDGNIILTDGKATINHDQGLTMDVISADVEYNLSSDNDLLYAYLLQGKENALPDYQADFLTELQKTQNFTYVEMEESNPNKGHEYPNGEHHYFVGENNLKTGVYGSSFMSYAPSVSTWGIQRRYYEDDGYDNTYGAPIWKTGVGKVTMDDSELMAEKQQNAWNSVNWTTDAGPASLFILNGFKATGLLPKTTVATVQYEPYMFRIFVESPSGKLRPYKTVADANGNGEHLDALVPDDELTPEQMYGPISIWDGYIQYDEDGEIIGTDAANKVTVGYAPDDDDPTQTAYTYTKDKVDRPGGSSNGGVGNQDWDQDSNNAMFGALDAIVPANGDKISTNDLKVFVRFYYAVKGEIASHTVVRGEGSRSGNGAESEGSPAGPSNSVFEISYHGEVVGQTYYNVQGMESDKPFDGVNIVVTRYSDGSVVTTKVVK